MQIFTKFFRGACPRTPPELFLLLNQLQICFAEIKTTLAKNVEIMAPVLKVFAAQGCLHSICKRFYRAVMTSGQPGSDDR